MKCPVRMQKSEREGSHPSGIAVGDVATVSVGGAGIVAVANGMEVDASNMTGGSVNSGSTVRVGVSVGEWMRVCAAATVSVAKGLIGVEGKPRHPLKSRTKAR